MKLCKECRKKPLPYIMVMLISSLAAFLTWLTLSTAGLTPEQNRIWSTGAFLVVAAVLVTYMVRCMRRHCSEDQHSH